MGFSQFYYVAEFFESEFLETQLASATPSILDRFRQAIKRADFYNGSPARLSDVDLPFLRAFEKRLRGDGMTKDRAIALRRNLRDVARAARLWLGDRREQIRLEEKQQRTRRLGSLGAIARTTVKSPFSAIAPWKGRFRQKRGRQTPRNERNRVDPTHDTPEIER